MEEIYGIEMNMIAKWRHLAEMLNSGTGLLKMTLRK